MRARYAEGSVPWDHELPPPEVIDTFGQMTPGRMLDLGSGLGRAAIYLAGQGWEVDGVDFVAEAVAETRTRVATAGVAERVHLHVGSVTRLDFLRGPFDAAVDVGCAHSLDDDDLTLYADEVTRLLRPGGLYLLFTRLRAADAEPTTEGPPGLVESFIRSTFEAAFDLERVEHGTTQVGDRPTYTSAWFWFRRRVSRRRSDGTRPRRLPGSDNEDRQPGSHADDGDDRGENRAQP